MYSRVYYLVFMPGKIFIEASYISPSTLLSRSLFQQTQLAKRLGPSIGFSWRQEDSRRISLHQQTKHHHQHLIVPTWTICHFGREHEAERRLTFFLLKSEPMRADRGRRRKSFLVFILFVTILWLHCTMQLVLRLLPDSNNFWTYLYIFFVASSSSFLTCSFSCFSTFQE